MTLQTQHASKLIKALEEYYGRYGSFFPVDETEMRNAMISVKRIIAQHQRDKGSIDAVVAMIHNEDLKDEEVLWKLVNLATALTDYDDDIHDALMFV